MILVYSKHNVGVFVYDHVACKLVGFTRSVLAFTVNSCWLALPRPQVVDVADSPADDDIEDEVPADEAVVEEAPAPEVEVVVPTKKVPECGLGA